MYTVFVDGSTRISNKKGANNIGGFGYVVYDDSGYIVDTFSKQIKNTTNNEMELYALYYAIVKYATEEEWGCPIIYSDSQYAINCATVWGPQWKANNWIKSDGGEVQNVGVIAMIVALLEQLYVDIRKCDGHKGVEGNELADALATGAMTAEEVYFSDTKYRIPNQGYFAGPQFKSNSNYKDDPNYWIIGIEDGWIKPDETLWNWYKQYKEENQKNDKR